MLPVQRKMIEKLNVLLDVPRKIMSNADWNEKRRELVGALYDRKTVTQAHKDMWSPDKMYDALETLRLGIRDMRAIGRTTFAFKEHNLVLYASPGRPIFPMYGITDGHTAVFRAFQSLVENLGLSIDRFLTCADSGCQRTFVPLRKPPKGKRAYCRSACARRVAVREFRQRHAEELRKRESDRNHRRYTVKARKRYGAKVKVGRRPRNTTFHPQNSLITDKVLLLSGYCGKKAKRIN
jgi:hypothetical protein